MQPHELVRQGCPYARFIADVTASGTDDAVQRPMVLRLIAIGSKKCVEVDPRTFGRLLHLARLQGWEPDTLPCDWPSASGDTEVILRDTKEHSDCCVSKHDADGLRRALTRLMATDGVSFDKDLYIAASRFIQYLGDSAFLVKGEPGVETVFSQLMASSPPGD